MKVREITHQRECARPGCHDYFESPHGGDWPARYCSRVCHSADRSRPEPAPRAQLRRVESTRKPRAISPASPQQRAAIRDRACIVCACHAGSCHPAHLIDKSLAADGDGDPRAVVPLCPQHHRAYDEGGLSILEYLEPHWRTELAYAVERYGLLRTLQRVTGSHWAPLQGDSAA